MGRLAAQTHVVGDGMAFDQERMREARRFEERRARTHLGKRIGRMLVSEGRERGKRLELADRLQPDRQRTPMGRVPAVDGRGGLAANQQDGRERSEKQVVRRIDCRHIALQPRDDRRWQLAVCHERLVQCCEPGRLKGFALQPDQELRDQSEIVQREIETVKHGRDLAAPEED